MTDAERHLMTVFADVLELASPAERAAYMDRACGDNPALRQEVESLLQAHARIGRFLVPQAAAAGGVTYAADKEIPEQTRDGHTTAPQTAAETPGTVIGPYKLLEPIGEGGMGTVWMAQQTEPVRRLVALKLIKAGMDSKQVIARFEAERQALALMDHANIARVLDAGTSSGRPYFVMDLVKGVPITKYCDEHHLTPRQRLELFIPVCQAVQHAHQKGIIHRDLKPSNVLVALYDGKPVPKVIDFGVAKAAGQPLTDKTLVTGFGNIVGTLEYMSPEQAEFNQLDIDTRSDVYSLGVLLYELLAGSPPFTRQELTQAGMLEMLRVIREQEPSMPSTKLSTADGLPTLAANRGTEPAKLTKLVRGELDLVVMKCLEKDRNRRYDTAASLGRDIERYLGGEMVQACPPSLRYRLRKWVRRHRRLVLAAAALATLLVAVAGVATVAAFREQHLKREAEAKADALDHSLYYHRIDLAAQRLATNQLGPVEALLEGCPLQLRGWEWHYLRRWQHVAPHTDLPGADLTNICAAFSPDGKTIAVGGGDTIRGTLRLWDVATSKRLRTLNGHGTDVHAVAFHPDGRLASGSRDGTVRIWDPATGKELQRYRLGRLVTSVAFSPDGEYLLTAGFDLTTRRGEAQVRETATGQVVLTLDGQVRAAFSPDGRRLAAADADGVITLRDAVTGRVLLTCPGRSAFSARLMWPVVFSPDGRLLATTNDDTAIPLWDTQTGQVAHRLSGHSAPPWCLAFSPDGRRLASAGLDRVVKVWDLTADQEVLTLRGHKASIESLAFSPDGRRLVSGAQDKSVKVWDATPVDGPVGPLVCTFTGHTGLVGQAAFHPESHQVVSVSADGSLQIWDAHTGRVVRILPNKAQVAFTAAYSPDGRLLASGAQGNLVIVRDATTGEERLRYQGHSTLTIRLAFSPKGTRIASLDALGDLHIWESSSGKDLATLKCAGKGLAVAWSPDGRFVAAGNTHGLLKVWDAQTFQEVLSRQLELGQTIGGLAFSPDGQTLAMCERAPNFSLLNVATGQTLRTFVGHSERVLALAYSPDGRFLASGAEDGILKIWDAASGRELRTLRGHSGLISTLAYSSDGRLLASACWDKTVKIWDATVSAEVHHGQDARAAVDARFAKLLLRDDVLEDLRGDAALSDGVRQLALQQAQEEEENPVQLNNAAYEAVKEPSADTARYCRALRWAEAACRLEPGNGAFLNTLAAVQCRLGKYDSAQATLAGAEPLNIARFGGPWPRDLALRAIIQIQQDQMEPARATLASLRDILQSPRWSGAVEGKRWQRDAETLLENKKTQSLKRPQGRAS